MRNLIKKILVEHQLEIHFPPEEELQKYISILLQEYDVSDFNASNPLTAEDLQAEIVDFLTITDEDYKVEDHQTAIKISDYFVKEHYPYGMDLEQFLGELYKPHDDSMKNLVYSILGEKDESQCYETSNAIADAANEMALLEYYQEPYDYDEDDDEPEGEWVECTVRSSCYGVYINDPNDRGCVLEDNITTQFFEYLDDDIQNLFEDYCRTDLYQVSIGLVNDIGWSLAKAKNVKPYQQLMKFRDEFPHYLRAKLQDRIEEYAKKYLDYVESSGTSIEVVWNNE